MGAHHVWAQVLLFGGALRTKQRTVDRRQNVFFFMVLRHYRQKRTTRLGSAGKLIEAPSCNHVSFPKSSTFQQALDDAQETTTAVRYLKIWKDFKKYEARIFSAF